LPALGTAEERGVAGSEAGIMDFVSLVPLYSACLPANLDI
jgi:hypothetical protein